MIKHADGQTKTVHKGPQFLWYYIACFVLVLKGCCGTVPKQENILDAFQV